MKTRKKTAIVTGSSTGLGAYLGYSLGKEGFNVVVNYSKRRRDAYEVGRKLSKITDSLVIKGDVSKYSDAKKIVKQTKKKFGKIDVLVNNAGIHIDATVLKTTYSSWKKVIDTNLTGTFNCSKAVLPIMIEQNFGRIINISSFTAITGISGAANYSASKAGIIGFTKSLAQEVAKNGITVNAIAPGYFDIGMFHDFDDRTKNQIIGKIPMKRLGLPEEISDLVKILISSSYMTGQVFVLDGGFSL